MIINEEDIIDNKTLKEFKDEVFKPYIDKLIYLLQYAEFNINNNILLIGSPSITLFDYVSDKFPDSTVIILDNIDTEFKNNYYPLSGNAFIFSKKYKELLTDLYMHCNSNSYE